MGTRATFRATKLGKLAQFLEESRAVSCLNHEAPSSAASSLARPAERSESIVNPQRRMYAGAK